MEQKDERLATWHYPPLTAGTADWQIDRPEISLNLLTEAAKVRH